MIVLQFVRGTELDSRLIEWFGHGAQFSHVDSVSPFNGSLIGARSGAIGGVPSGVYSRVPDYVGDAETLRIELPCSQEITDAYYEFLGLQIGKPYDKEGILAFVAGRDWQDPGAWFCSELVAAGLQASGYFTHQIASPSNKITPPDLVLMLSVLTDVQLKETP